MRILFFLWLSVLGIPLHAQHLLGLTPSNYAGTNALAHNPAFVVDSRYKVYINLVGNDFFVINNYVSYDAPFSLLKLMNRSVPNEYKSSAGKVVFKEDYLQENINGNDKRAHFGGDLRGPSVLFSINDKQALALTSRVRYGVNMNGFSEPVANLLRFGPGNHDYVPRSADNQHFALNANGYMEVGLTYGRVLVNDGDWFVKVGASVKRLVGLYNLHLNSPNASYEVVPSVVDPTKVSVRVQNSAFLYGYTDQGSYKDFLPTPRFLTGKDAAGGGWAFDIGFVYEYRPDFSKYDYIDEKHKKRLDPSQNKYKYRLAVSLVDWGFLRYNNAKYVGQYSIQGRDFTIDESYFTNLKDANGVTYGFDRTFYVYNLPKNTSFAAALPSSIQASFDSQIRDKVYMNLFWVQNVVGDFQVGMKQQSQLAVTPRYESRWFEFALPVALLDQYSRLSIGAATRLGPLTVGTDHLGGLLNLGKPRGLDFYFNVAVPIFQKRPPSPLMCPPWQEEKPRFWQKVQFWKNKKRR
ncbi:MAG: DUF5723 family protein [Spirosomataceae bacterium]